LKTFWTSRYGGWSRKEVKGCKEEVSRATITINHEFLPEISADFRNLMKGEGEHLITTDYRQSNGNFLYDISV
jgi:hypothetical protein